MVHRGLDRLRTDSVPPEAAIDLKLSSCSCLVEARPECDSGGILLHPAAGGWLKSASNSNHGLGREI